MKYLYSILLILLFVFCSISNNQAQSDHTAKVKNALTSELNQFYTQGYFNGFGVAIVDEKGVLYENGFGLADVSVQKKYTRNTIQNIASISKTFVGVALMKAHELEKLKLDDPINKYLPFKVINPYFPNEEITIRHLATHTSGIIDNEFYLTKNYYLKSDQDLDGLKLVFEDTQVFNTPESKISLKTFLENLLTPSGRWYQKEGFLNRQPGENYEYSNVGTVLAAYIIEIVSGMPFDNFPQKYILKPLKMNDSGWKFSDVNFSNYSKLYENPKTVLPFYGMNSYPDGNFITSTHDLSKYLVELIKGYNGKGKILTKKSYAELFHPQLTAINFEDRNIRNPYSESFNVGIFMGFGYTGYIGHTGGDPGVVSIMFFNPKTNIGRIMIFNTSFSDQAGNKAFYRIWDILEKYQTKLKDENRPSYPD